MRGELLNDSLHATTTVLVVEDEVLIRLAISDYLRLQGFRIVEASNADEARQLLSVDPTIRIVFSDVRMSGNKMDGVELADWIEKNRPHVGVILTSAYPRGQISHRWAGNFISKTYQFREVAELITSMLTTLKQAD
jgi:DNA-binding NtrC family response regulator